MKKAFTLLFTLLVVTILSFVSIKIFETKSINSINLTNKYVYMQASNHLNFLQEYIEILPSLENIENISIKNKNFYINANIKKVTNKYEVFLEVSSKNFDVRVQRTLTK